MKKGIIEELRREIKRCRFQGFSSGEEQQKQQQKETATEQAKAQIRVVSN